MKVVAVPASRVVIVSVIKEQYEKENQRHAQWGV